MMTGAKKNWQIGSCQIVAVDPAEQLDWPIVFERSLADPLTRRQLIELYEFVSGTSVNRAAQNVHDLRQLIEFPLSDAFRQGRLQLVSDVSRAGSNGSEAFREAETLSQRDRAVEREAARKRREQEDRLTKTWVEIELLSKRGKPVADESYRLKLPDGSVRSGKLNQDGRVRVPSVDPMKEHL